MRAILNYPVTQRRDDAGFDIDLDPGTLYAIGDAERRAGSEVARCSQFWLSTGRQQVMPEMTGIGDIGETHANFPGRFVADAARPNLEAFGI